jgi:hypothetical protein
VYKLKYIPTSAVQSLREITSGGTRTKRVEYHCFKLHQNLTFSISRSFCVRAVNWPRYVLDADKWTFCPGSIHTQFLLCAETYSLRTVCRFLLRERQHLHDLHARERSLNPDTDSASSSDSSRGCLQSLQKTCHEQNNLKRQSIAAKSISVHIHNS